MFGDLSCWYYQRRCFPVKVTLALYSSVKLTCVDGYNSDQIFSYLSGNQQYKDIYTINVNYSLINMLAW